MKRKLSTVLVAALIILLLAATALAVTLNRSNENMAVRSAQEALMEKYGITHETIGLFVPTAEYKEGAWHISFRSVKYNDEAMGTYHVTIPAGKAPEASWSHDGTTVDFENADLTSPVWGAKQLEMALHLDQAYAIKRNEERMGQSLEEKAAYDEMLREYGDMGMAVNILPEADDIQEDEAIALAKSLAEEKYGLTQEALSTYETNVDFRLHVWNGERLYDIRLMGEQPDEADRPNAITVRFFSPSGEVQMCNWSIDPALRTLPQGPLDGYEEAVREFVKAGSFDLLSAADKADVGTRINEAGYGEYIDDLHYIAPAAGDIPETEAQVAAVAGLEAAYGVTPEMLVLFEEAIAFVEDDGTRCWLVVWSPKQARYWPQDFPERYGVYRVWIDAETGGAHRADWTYDGVEMDGAYTQSNWAKAPAWDSDILPWALAFHEAQEALEDKYSHTNDTLWALEDFAARDALFRGAGFDQEGYYRYGLPGEGELTEAEAMALAQAALKEDFALTDEAFDHFLVMTAFYIDDPQKNIWVVTYFNTLDGGLSSYAATLESITGEILDTEYIATGNG